MSRWIFIPAKYVKTGVSTYDGNPFIEALPALESRKNDILDRLTNYPPKATAADRKKGEVARIAELSRINDIVYPFPEYKKAGVALTTNIRDPYIARNPLTKIDQQRRHAIAAQEKDGVPFPSNWKSSAKGQVLMGISGSGKTTFADAFSLPYQIVIDHTAYHGNKLDCRQVPWIKLRVSHDATLKSLCLQFFGVVDSILGTQYYRQAKAIGGISQMVQLMVAVATAISLAAIFIDEVQNLKSARGGNAEFVLNLFSEIIERVGVTLIIAATPAVEVVIGRSVRNLRKLNTGGEIDFKPMHRRDPTWKEYCEVYWDYSFTKKKGRLTDSILDSWHETSGGNAAFGALSFMLGQRSEIGGREVIDEQTFKRVANTDMALLQPAIRALRSNDESLLRQFDDLLFKDGCNSLRQIIRWSDGSEIPAATREEFDDIPPASPKVEARRTKRSPSKPKAKLGGDVVLPMENPFAAG